VGPPSQRGEKGGGVPLRGFARLGLGPVSELGQFGSPRPFFIFFISFPFYFSDFLVSLLSFARMLQIHSNHFQKLSKNQNGYLKQ
jgi:hypothetical protein